MKNFRYVFLWFIITFLLGCSDNKNRRNLSEVQVNQTLCVSSHIPTQNDIASATLRKKELELLSSAGVYLLRRDFLWHEIEPEKDKFDFSGYDRIVDEAKNYGMEFIGLLAYGNSWASQKSIECIKNRGSGCTNYPPDNPEDFADFVRETVAHFRGRVKYWEVWNEPNLGPSFFKPLSDPQKYAEILKAAYTSAKQSDPDSTVSFAGVLMPDYLIEPSGIEFIKEVFNREPDIKNYFDALAFHPYMYPYPPSLPPEQDTPPSQGSIITTINSLKETMKELGIESKPLWITEIGWPTIDNLPEELQAAYLVRSILLSLSKGINIYCWYTTWDADGTLFPEAENYFGLIRHFDPMSSTEPIPKRAYLALKTLSQIAGDYHVVLNNAITNDEDTYIIELNLPDRPKKILVIWAVEKSDNVLTVSVENLTPRVLNLYGDEIPINFSNGNIVIQPETMPVFVLLE